MVNASFLSSKQMAFQDFVNIAFSSQRTYPSRFFNSNSKIPSTEQGFYLYKDFLIKDKYSFYDISAAKLFIERPWAFFSFLSELGKSSPKIAQNSCFLFSALRNEELRKIFLSDPAYLRSIMLNAGEVASQRMLLNFAAPSYAPFEKTARFLGQHKEKWLEISRMTGQNFVFILSGINNLEETFSSLFSSFIETEKTLDTIIAILKTDFGKKLQSTSLCSSQDIEKNIGSLAQEALLHEGEILDAIHSQNYALYLLINVNIGKVREILERTSKGL